MKPKMLPAKAGKKLPAKEEKEELIFRAWSFEKGSFGAIKQVNYLIKGDKIISKKYGTEDVREIILSKIRREMIDVTMEG